MGAEYKAYYKCRHCGETFTGGQTTGRARAIMHIVDLVSIGRPMDRNAPRMLSEHNCDGLGYKMGLADFIGWKHAQLEEKEEA